MTPRSMVTCGSASASPSTVIAISFLDGQARGSVSSPHRVIAARAMAVGPAATTSIDSILLAGCGFFQSNSHHPCMSPPLPPGPVWSEPGRRQLLYSPTWVCPYPMVRSPIGTLRNSRQLRHRKGWCPQGISVSWISNRRLNDCSSTEPSSKVIRYVPIRSPVPSIDARSPEIGAQAWTKSRRRVFSPTGTVTDAETPFMAPSSATTTTPLGASLAASWKGTPQNRQSPSGICFKGVFWRSWLGAGHSQRPSPSMLPVPALKLPLRSRG